MEIAEPDLKGRRYGRCRIVWRQLQASLWTLVSKPMLALVVFPISSEGARLVLPSLAKRLSSLPFLTALGDYEATYQLDLAHCFALALMVAAFTMSGRLIAIRLGLRCAAGGETPEGRKFIVGLGILVLLTDLGLFYLGVQEVTWGSAGLAPGPLLAAIAYISVVLFVSYVAVTLHERVLEAMGE